MAPIKKKKKEKKQHSRLLPKRRNTNKEDSHTIRFEELKDKKLKTQDNFIPSLCLYLNIYIFYNGHALFFEVKAFQ